MPTVTKKKPRGLPFDSERAATMRARQTSPAGRIEAGVQAIEQAPGIVTVEQRERLLAAVAEAALHPIVRDAPPLSAETRRKLAALLMADPAPSAVVHGSLNDAFRGSVAS